MPRIVVTKKQKAKQMLENPSKNKKLLSSGTVWKIIMDDFMADRRAMIKKDLPAEWKRQERMYNNEWWEDGSRPDHLTFGTNNGLFEVIETTLPVVTAKSPTPDIKYQPTAKALDIHLARMDEDPEEEGISREELQQLAEQMWKAEKEVMFIYAQGLRRELMNIWYRTEMQTKVKMAYREYSIKGTNIIKSVWSKTKKMIVNTIVDIRTIVPYRFADNIEACEDTHLTHCSYKSAQWIHKKFGVPLKDIKADGYLQADGIFKLFDEKPEESPSGGVSGQVNDHKTDIDADGEGLKKKSEALTLVLQYYCNGELTAEEEAFEGYHVTQYDKESGDETGKTYHTRKKWEDGRVITIARGCKNRILKDEPRVYRKLPFFRSANYERAGDFWGTPEGRQIEEHIRMQNMIMSNINDNARLTGNPQKERVIGSEVKEVTNMAGKVYDSAIPNGVRNINPPPMPAYIRLFFQDLQAMVDRITGITDAFRGIAKSGDSGVKVRSLIDQGVGRLQPKTLAFTELSRKLFIHWADIISKFYPEKIVHQTDDKSGKARYEVFNPKEVPEAVYDVNVALTAMLPTDLEGQFIEAMELAMKGMEIYGIPLIAPEHLIELAPTLEDKQRAKEFFAEMQEKVRQQAQQGQQAQGSERDALIQQGVSEEDADAILQARADGDEEEIAKIMAKYTGEQG